MKQKQKNFFAILSGAVLLLAGFLFLQPAPKVLAQASSCSQEAVQSETVPGGCQQAGGIWNDSTGTCSCGGGSSSNSPTPTPVSNCQIYGFTGQACCDAYSNDSVCAAYKASGQSTGPAAANDSCVTPFVQSNCGAGLICASNYTCQPTGSYGTVSGNNTTGGFPAGSTPAAGTSGSPGTSNNCNGDPNLTFNASSGLCLPAQSSFPTTGIAGSTTLSGLILIVIQLLLTFAGIIAVIMLILGGYWYMAAGGNEEMSEKGKNTIINFVIGLVVILLAYTIVTILSNTLTTNQFTK